VLVVAAPLLGHVLPLVPFATALRVTGHEVLVAAGDVAGHVGGLPAHDLAPGFRLDRHAVRVLATHPLVARRELQGRAGTRGVGLLFGAVNAGLLGPVEELVAQWRPDLVVHEPLACAAAVAAARHRVPAVLQDNTLVDGVALVAATATARPMREAALRLGVTTVPAPALRLVTAPPSLVGRQPGRPLRPVPYAGDGPVPAGLERRGELPRLLVSHSTVPGPGGNTLRPVLAAVAGLDADVVVLRAPEGPMPANVRPVGWVPLPALLPHADAIVHHGGAGTVLAALAFGVPQLVIPGPGDRRHNGELVARPGAGLTGAPLRSTITRLLADDGLRSAAAEVRAEIAAMPDPADVAAAVLAGTR
jgi:UDP:flavonoid glycosyltransferase YjiC (YdhE family)